MSLSSASFLLIFSASLLLYFLLPKKAQWVFLLVLSLTLKCLFSGTFPIYVAITSLITYLAAISMEAIRNKASEAVKTLDPTQKDEKKRLNAAEKKREKVVLISSVVINLAILSVFKYGNTFLSVVRPSASVRFLLPLGISFYTFQSLGYVIDVYRKKATAQKNFFKVLLFLCYFPQIIEGPINRYDALSPDLFGEHRFSFERFKKGVLRILWGFLKKLVIADNLAIMVNPSKTLACTYDGFQLLCSMMLFGIQLYADFSGYMDIVIGLSEILGIPVAENFKRPYFSKNVTEFWRKWHMSLCTWFRDYVFYSVFMSKPMMNLGKKLRSKGKKAAAKNVPTYLAMILIWFLTGVWHAMNGPEILWGICNGLIMIAAIQFKPLYQKINKFLHIGDSSPVWNAVRMVRTFVIMTVLNYMSEFPTLAQFGNNISKIAHSFFPKSLSPAYLFPNLMDSGIIVLFAVFFAALMLFAYSFAEERGNDVIKKVVSSHWVIQVSVTLFLLFFVLAFSAVGDAAGGFMYAQF